jgi:pimeloyl-ACP methyl ester carboxylesterase
VAAFGVVAAALSMSVLPGSLRTAQAAERPDPLQQYRLQKLSWGTCPEQVSGVEGLECTRITVPLDYRHPAAAKITVGVSRLRSGATVADGASRPVLFMNPGGPGASAMSMPNVFRQAAPAKVTGQYDLIGMDPRGQVGGTALTCKLSTEAEINFAYGSERPYRSATFTWVADTSRSLADKCAKVNGPKLRFFTTANTARDMDLLRTVLRAPKISYYGMSYGTYLGEVYSQMFPQRVDRMVLDSVVDPTTWGRQYFMELAPASQKAFTRWTVWAAKHDKKYHFGRTPRQVQNEYDRVLRGVGETVGDAFRPGFRRSVFDMKNASKTFQNLREVLADPEELRQQQRDLEKLPGNEPASENSVEDAAFTALNFAVLCQDSQDWPKDLTQYRRDADAGRAKYPLAGDIYTNVRPCAFWKYRSVEPRVRVGNAVKMLLVQNEWDAQTALPGARAAHRTLKGSAMITVKNGQGHGVYTFDSSANPCASQLVSSYLSTGSLPNKKDVTCTDPVPKP